MSQRNSGGDQPPGGAAVARGVLQMRKGPWLCPESLCDPPRFILRAALTVINPGATQAVLGSAHAGKFPCKFRRLGLSDMRHAPLPGLRTGFTETKTQYKLALIPFGRTFYWRQMLSGWTLSGVKRGSWRLMKTMSRKFLQLETASGGWLNLWAWRCLRVSRFTEEAGDICR